MFYEPNSDPPVMLGNEQLAGACKQQQQQQQHM